MSQKQWKSGEAVDDGDPLLREREEHEREVEREILRVEDSLFSERLDVQNALQAGDMKPVARGTFGVALTFWDRRGTIIGSTLLCSECVEDIFITHRQAGQLEFCPTCLERLRPLVMVLDLRL